MKKCPNCNFEVPDGNKFCGKCGNVITKAKKKLIKRPAFWVSTVAGVLVLFIIIGILVSNGNSSLMLPMDTYDTSSEPSSNPDTETEIESQSDVVTPQTYELSRVGFPPAKRVGCQECSGSGKGTCIQCDGTGLGTQSTLDSDLLDEFGLGGLQSTINSLPCTLCSGSGEWNCLSCYGSGEISNPDYYQYYMDLVSLADQTGMRIFELEDNQVSPYIGFYFCKMCNGSGWLPELKVHETDIPLCQQCFAEGVRFEYLDSFSDEDLYRDYNLIYDAEIYEIAGDGGGGSDNSGGDNSSDRGTCIIDGCTKTRTIDGGPYCSSHRASSGVDLGGEGTGYCPMCGDKVYTTDAYCARCR